MKTAKPKEMSVYSKASINKELFDCRRYTHRQTFGKLSDIVRQYGIKVEYIGTCFKFSAPKSRLQLLIEKLHFSRTPYSESPY